MSITAAQARIVIDAAVAAAIDQGLPPLSLWVLDAQAWPVAFHRMDGAVLGSIDVAMGKARTAALFRTDSGNLAGLVQPGAPGFTLENSNGGLMAFPGGALLKDANGIVLGALGVSGARGDQDQAVAEAGRAAALTAPLP